MAEEYPYWIFYLILAVAAILPRIPYVGKYFQVFNTLIHEDGHAIMALISRGRAKRIELFADTSGTTLTTSKHKISHFLTSLAGYPASAGGALLLFWLMNKQDELSLLIAISALIAFNLILFVRNAYGIVWLITFGALLYGLYYLNNLLAINIAVTFFSGILFWGSLLSPLELIGIAWKTPRQAGDASNLNNSTGIPSLFWSLLFLVISLFVAWFTVQQFPLAEQAINYIKELLT